MMRAESNLETLTAFSALKPIARRQVWAHILAAFRRGSDTVQIAKDLMLTEAEVANALHYLREKARQ